MSDQLSNFEAHRAQLAAGLAAVADSLRNCATIAENFAKIVNDPSYSAEAADLLNGASDDSGKRKRKVALSPDEDGPKKRKRNTKPKDPNAPRRPASSYILFQNEVRKELKEQHPHLSNGDLLGMISEQWKHMSDEQKEVYNQAMKNAKAQYSEEKKAYDNRSPEEIEAANAAAAAAAKLKKANAKPRGPKGAAAVVAVVAATPVKARPPPTADEVSPTSESEEDDDSEEEEAPEPKRVQVAETESSEEEEEPQPAPKKRRGASVQPKVQKGKKGSKA